MIKKNTLPKGPSLPDDKVSVTFELPATVWAKQVAVVGEFNGWDPTAHLLRQERDGTWRLSVQLDRHRRYQFRYLLNGTQWLNDWAADDYVPNRSGGFNSVVST